VVPTIVQLELATPDAIVFATAQNQGASLLAHFSDRGRLFQADRGRRFSAIVDARRLRASGWFNVSQSSTISLKCHADGRLRT
jgi:hypothetical protein